VGVGRMHPTLRPMRREDQRRPISVVSSLAPYHSRRNSLIQLRSWKVNWEPMLQACAKRDKVQETSGGGYERVDFKMGHGPTPSAIWSRTARTDCSQLRSAQSKRKLSADRYLRAQRGGSVQRSWARHCLPTSAACGRRAVIRRPFDFVDRVNLSRDFWLDKLTPVFYSFNPKKVDPAIDSKQYEQWTRIFFKRRSRRTRVKPL
jgi:hypothetical protein